MLITNNYKIQENNTIIGEICLWQYEGFEYPHIEFEIKKDYQRQGFMTKHLPIFLEQITDKVIVAVVNPSNLVSIKLLTDNSFVELGNIGGYKNFIYINKKASTGKEGAEILDGNSRASQIA